MWVELDTSRCYGGASIEVWWGGPGRSGEIRCKTGWLGSPRWPACGTRWVSISEAARLLGTSRATVRKKVDTGVIPSWKLDRHWGISLDWIEKHTGKTQKKHYATQKGETN